MNSMHRGASPFSHPDHLLTGVVRALPILQEVDLIVCEPLAPQLLFRHLVRILLNRVDASVMKVREVQVICFCLRIKQIALPPLVVLDVGADVLEPLRSQLRI